MATVRDLSGNSPFPPDEKAVRVLAGTLSDEGSGEEFPIEGLATLFVWGTFVATWKIEASPDDGITWLVASRDSAATEASYTGHAKVNIEEPMAGALYRVTCTSHTSGTINYKWGR